MENGFPHITASDLAWLWQALASPLSMVSLLWLVILVPSIFLLLHLIRHLAIQPRKLSDLFTNDDGTAMIEFALVLPFLLFMMLLLAQVTLLSAGNLQVHYAGYAATRTAIVQIPADHRDRGGSGSNVISADYSESKFSRIHQAGALACVPISGRESTGSINAAAYTDGLRQYFGSLGRPVEPWVAKPLEDRVRYAFNHTFITLATNQMNSDGTVTPLPLALGQSHAFGPRDPVTVRLLHEMSLSVPYVRAFFADGNYEGGRFANVLAQYTLTNEGDPTELPEKPALERVP